MLGPASTVEEVYMIELWLIRGIFGFCYPKFSTSSTSKHYASQMHETNLH